jgi:hypothetical protein
MVAGGVERRVADNAQAAEVKDGGRTADHHGRALLPRHHASTIRWTVAALMAVSSFSGVRLRGGSSRDSSV